MAKFLSLGAVLVLLQLFLFANFYAFFPKESVYYDLMQFYFLFGILPFALNEVRSKLFSTPLFPNVFFIIGGAVVSWTILSSTAFLRSELAPDVSGVAYIVLISQFALVATMENLVFIEWLGKQLPLTGLQKIVSISAIAGFFHFGILTGAGFFNVLDFFKQFMNFTLFQIIANKFNLETSIGVHAGMNVYNIGRGAL